MAVRPCLRVFFLRVLLGDIGEHEYATALVRLEVLRARLLKQRLRLRPRRALVYNLSLVYSWIAAYFFMACLVLKACNFCVAGLMMSSDGETNFCSLSIVSDARWDMNMYELTVRCLGATAELDGGSRGSWSPSSRRPSLGKTWA